MGEAQGIGFGVENFMQEMHAQGAFERQKNLMIKQQKMNQANALNAYQNQVQGMRMAGLNPAGAMQHAPSVPSVSQGSADMGSTMPFNPQLDLAKAQVDNIKAQTEKLKAEVPNVNEDTNLKMAQKLFTGANTDKVNEEAQNLRNMNVTFAAENDGLKEMGKGMAEKWQASSWYNSLGQDTKDTIDAIAAGEIPLSVGGMNALKKVIDTQANLSDADKKLVQNAFDTAVLESQFNDKAIMDAIAQAPLNMQEKLKAERDKIMAEAERIKYRMKEFIDAEIKGKKLSNEQLDAAIKAFKRDDLGYLKSQGEYGKWFESYAEKMLMNMIPILSGGSVAGRMMRQPTQKGTQGSQYNWDDSGFGDGNVKRSSNWSPANPNGIGSKPDGVSQFDWNQMQKRANKNHYQ